ncbi:putative RNA recognition motif domain, nucleotide-binding alpha-beta plait domain superfamily [Helianthus annuus]|nr:putative RNA recognition motif domain, nucleotide-binding alpha-beta plait domain superfamily [Helianthus annuus]
MVVTKYFVANLPEGSTPWELRKALEGYGDIAGTYVAKKKDKGGGRFGFVSFANVRDRSELESSLSGARMGDNKLKINIAKFALENGHGSNPSERKKPFHRQPEFGAGIPFNVRDTRSYRDALGKGKMEGSGKEAGSSLQASGSDGRKMVVVPDRTSAFREVWGKAVVGRTVDLETLVDLDRLFRIAKVGYVNFQYLGGLSVLISFCDNDAASVFLDSKGLWGPWFSKLALWEGQSLPFERVAWLRVMGLPLHLVDMDVLKSVGELFGKFLHVQKSFDDVKDLSVSRVGILVGDMERVKEFVSLRWKDRSFRIWVEEELDIWIPDCLEGVEGGSPVSSSPLASSPVGAPEGGENLGGLNVEDEELCMGNGARGEVDPAHSSSNSGGSGGVPKEVCFNWQPFMDSCSGNVPNPSGTVKSDILFFKASKKAKRFRKGGPCCQHREKGASPTCVVDSLDRGRPKKRYRGNLEADSDPFSLENLFELLKNKEGGGGSDIHEGASVWSRLRLLPVLAVVAPT